VRTHECTQTIVSADEASMGYELFGGRSHPLRHISPTWFHSSSRLFRLHRQPLRDL